MKISIISIFCPPEKGAAPYRILNTAKELKNKGADVEIITALANYPTGKIFESYKGYFCKLEEVEEIPCRRYWLYPSNSNNPIVRVFSMFSFAISLIFAIPHLYRRKSDVIFVQSPPLLVGYAATIIGRLLGSKIALNISDIWPLTASELGVIKKDSISYKFFSWIESRMYRNATAYIAQSQQTVDYLKEKTKEKPILLYRNLTKNSDFAPKKIDKAAIKIVYAGLLGLAQGVYSICKEIDFKAMNMEFHIYGNGVEKKLIEEYVKDNPTCNVFMHETVSKEEISKILTNFDATIIPLQKEIFGAFPSKISMAVASGLPIFFAGGGEGRDIVEAQKIGFVSPPGDIAALANNLSLFSTLDEESLQRIKNNVQNAGNTVFNYKAQQAELYKFIKSLILNNA